MGSLPSVPSATRPRSRARQTRRDRDHRDRHRAVPAPSRAARPLRLDGAHDAPRRPDSHRPVPTRPGTAHRTFAPAVPPPGPFPRDAFGGHDRSQSRSRCDGPRTLPPTRRRRVPRVLPRRALGHSRPRARRHDPRPSALGQDQHDRHSCPARRPWSCRLDRD